MSCAVNPRSSEPVRIAGAWFWMSSVGKQSILAIWHFASHHYYMFMFGASDQTKAGLTLNVWRIFVRFRYNGTHQTCNSHHSKAMQTLACKIRESNKLTGKWIMIVNLYDLRFVPFAFLLSLSRLSRSSDVVWNDCSSLGSRLSNSDVKPNFICAEGLIKRVKILESTFLYLLFCFVTNWLATTSEKKVYSNLWHTTELHVIHHWKCYLFFVWIESSSIFITCRVRSWESTAFFLSYKENPHTT